MLRISIFAPVLAFSRILVVCLLAASVSAVAQPMRVKDINPGPPSSDPAWFREVNGILYFSAGSGPGFGLYRSDGTEGGTVLVKEFSSRPDHITNVNGTVYFTVRPATSGPELWKSNGTPAGTMLVKDLTPFFTGFSANIIAMTGVGNTLYFSDFTPRLWKSDGTDAGTMVVAEVPASSLTEYNGSLYFLFGGFSSNQKFALAKSDGTAAGTTIVKRLRNDLPVNSGGIDFLENVNGTLYTMVSEGAFALSYTLWKSNGTEDGTVPVSPVWTGSRRSGMRSHVFTGNTLYFSAEDVPIGFDPDRGLYKFDLATNEVQQLANTRGTNDFYTELSSAGGKLFMVKSTGFPAVRTLFTMNGSTLSAVPGFTGSNPTGLTGVNETLFFAAEDAAGNELWKYSPAPVVPEAKAFRLNAGGSDYTGSTGNRFDADAYSTGGSLTRPVMGEVANTDDDELYHNGRYGGSFSYALPTGSGVFDVVLHFNETYWGNLVPGGAGSRQFNVDVEGDRKLTEFDIFARAGGAMRAVRETFRVNVTDGQLNLSFTQGSQDFARVEAIEVIPVTATFYRAINLNGGPLMLDGFAWEGSTAPNYTTNGRSFTNNSVPLMPATGADRTALIQSSVWHWSNLNVTVNSVPDGRYQVFLYTWEDNDPEVFTIRTEGITMTENYNSGPAGTWNRLGPYEVSISDGVIDVGTYGGSANISGIEVWRINSTTSARLAAQPKVEGAAGTLSVFPNPAADRISLETSLPAGTVTGTQIADATGKVYLQNGHRVTGTHTLEFNVAPLRKGLYFLRVQSGRGSQMVKFLKQ